MTVNIICEKNNFMGKIGFDTDIIDGLTLYGNSLGMIHVQHVVDFEELIKLRDKLIDMFPIEEKAEDVPEWRKEGEWEEISLEDAKDGDYAEFYQINDNIHVVCRLKSLCALLIPDRDNIIIGNVSNLTSCIRNLERGAGLNVKNLHIWRRVDPHRFDEPEEQGLYITQSGKVIVKDKSAKECWNYIDNNNLFVYRSWDELVEEFDESEFPLRKAKAVEE